MRLIPHNQPALGEEDIAAVSRTIKRKWLIAGTEVAEFEKNIAQFVGKRYAVAVNSGSSALHLALVILGIKKGDEVIIPTLTDTALLNAIHYQHARAVIADIEADGFNIDPKDIERKITKRTKAIIAPHTFGFPANLEEIGKFGIPVIEDAAQALGSTFRKRPLGSLEDLSVFSFYATKLIATGQGGMITTNRKDRYEQLRDLIHYDRRNNYIIRYNYQMTDLAASMGNAQAKKLLPLLNRRKEIADRYKTVLDKKSVPYRPRRDEQNINHFRFIIKLPQQNIRDKVQKSFQQHGITAIPPLEQYQLLHTLMHYKKGVYPHAEELASTTLSLPVFPGLSNEEIRHITSTLDKIL